MPRPWTQYVLVASASLLLFYFLFLRPASPSEYRDPPSWTEPVQNVEDITLPEHIDLPAHTDLPEHAEVPELPEQHDPLDAWHDEVLSPEKNLINPYGDDFLERQRQHYSRTLVIPRLANDTIGWITSGLADMEDLQLAIYVVDDENAALKVPSNKGNEAMVYLTHIIDNYFALPDVSIFMHAHGEHGIAWHNDELLDSSSGNMVRRLNTEKVLREGFVQLKCEHDSVCTSDAVYLHRIYHDNPWEIMKGTYLAEVWERFFPHETMPDFVVNPLGAQFAVSREAITRRPKEQYEAMRQYLIDTEKNSYVSGRIFEWLWAYIFTSNNVYCPNKLICYCDTYSVCFRTQHDMNEYEALYKFWESIMWSPASLDLPDGEDVGVAGQLREVSLKLQMRLQQLKEAAWARGSDEDVRRQILYDNWEVLKQKTI